MIIKTRELVKAIFLFTALLEIYQRSRSQSALNGMNFIINSNFLYSLDTVADCLRPRSLFWIWYCCFFYFRKKILFKNKWSIETFDVVFGIFCEWLQIVIFLSKLILLIYSFFWLIVAADYAEIVWNKWNKLLVLSCWDWSWLVKLPEQ